MPRGGARPGAGRPRKNPDAPAKAKKPAARKKAPAKKVNLGRGLTLPDGSKSPDAPAGWPFGTQAPEQPATAAVAPDPDEDDGLTDEQRASLSPLDYLLAVMRSPKASKSARITAAIQAAPYVHPKLAPMGKKEGRAAEAKTAAKGRFAASAPPRLVANAGKKV